MTETSDRVGGASRREARPIAQPHFVRLPQSLALRKPVLKEQAWQYTDDRSTVVENFHNIDMIM